MLHLLVRCEGAEERFTFTQEVISLGRTSNNIIQVRDTKASREHAELRRFEGGWKLVDLESSNGTSINGEKVNSHILKPGDVISIGAFEVVFEPEAKPIAHISRKPATAPLEKTVVDSNPAPAPVAAPVHHVPVTRSGGGFSFARKAAVIAALIVGSVIVTNKVRGAMAVREAQENVLASARAAADAGNPAGAVKILESFIVTNPEADLLRRASGLRDEYKAALSKKVEQATASRDKGISELLAKGQSLNADSRFKEVAAVVDSYLDAEDFAGAVDEAKRFMMAYPEGTQHDEMATRLSKVLAAAGTAWDALQDRANALTRAEKYADAVALLSSNRPRFDGTRFGYDLSTKVAAIQRLSGVTAAYASGAPEMSASAQESMLAVADLVKGRRYAEALSKFDKALSGMSAKEREALAGRRLDIERQTGIFNRLLASINSGELKESKIELGGGIQGWLSEASNLGLTIAFKDPSGSSGATGRKWVQVPGSDMLGYFRMLSLNDQEELGLASFCYENRLAEDGAEILAGLFKQEALKGEIFALIARERQMGVPADGFVYFESGWYTTTEFTYAKLDHKAKKGAQLVAKMDVKESEKGIATFRELHGDATLTSEFRAQVKGYYVKALKEKQTGIMKGLQGSGSIAEYRRLQEMKKELNLKRTEALRIIYDKVIYPDENHGVKGQPTVDDAVKLVRDMWDKSLTSKATLDSGVATLVTAAVQLNGWLAEMGEETNAEEMAEYQLLMAHIGETLNLKTLCLDDSERRIRDYNKKVWAFNKGGADTQMVGVELECAKITNEYREMMGRTCLELNNQLGHCAKKHSQEMVDLGYFAHESPTLGRETPSDRASQEKYTGPVGENICTGYGDARAAFLAWYNSSGHHRNMLSDAWNHIGLGNVGGSMWTENLGRAASQVATTSAGGSRAGGASSAPRGGASSAPRGGVKDPAAGADNKEPAAGDTGAAAGKDKPTAKKSPYTPPDGPCTGTAPYDPNKDKKQGEDPAPVDGGEENK